MLDYALRTTSATFEHQVFFFTSLLYSHVPLSCTILAAVTDIFSFLRLLDARRVVCTVRGLETLVDPQGLGPVSSLLLLLTTHNSTASALVAITGRTKTTSL